MKTLSVPAGSTRARVWGPFVGLAVVATALGAAWYVQRAREEQELSQRALEDIPKDEYEAWMQTLGYTD